jgi:hypothetical protein
MPLKRISGHSRGAEVCALSPNAVSGMLDSCPSNEAISTKPCGISARARAPRARAGRQDTHCSGILVRLHPFSAGGRSDLSASAFQRQKV